MMGRFYTPNVVVPSGQTTVGVLISGGLHVKSRAYSAQVDVRFPTCMVEMNWMRSISKRNVTCTTVRAVIGVGIQDCWQETESQHSRLQQNAHCRQPAFEH